MGREGGLVAITQIIPPLRKEEEDLQRRDKSLPKTHYFLYTMASFTKIPLTIATLLLVVATNVVVSAPIPSEQQDIADFSNSNKDVDVFLPFRNNLPERLIDNFDSKELDDERDMTSESDIFYFFGKTPVLTANTDARRRGGF